jgi:hypothetical protein
METMVDKALRDKGLAIRKAVLGEEYVNRAAAAAGRLQWSVSGHSERILLGSGVE